MTTTQGRATVTGVEARGGVYRALIHLAGRGLLVPLCVVVVLTFAGAAFVLVEPSRGAGVGSNRFVEASADARATTAPADILASFIAQEREVVDRSLLGYWVPQLASHPMQEAGASPYLALHEQLRASYGALLLDSGDFVFQRKEHWVSVAPAAYSDPEAALNWCRAEVLPGADCYAKLLTRDKSIVSTVAYRGDG